MEFTGFDLRIVGRWCIDSPLAFAAASVDIFLWLCLFERNLYTKNLIIISSQCRVPLYKTGNKFEMSKC